MTRVSMARYEHGISSGKVLLEYYLGVPSGRKNVFFKQSYPVFRVSRKRSSPVLFQ